MKIGWEMPMMDVDEAMSYVLACAEVVSGPIAAGMSATRSYSTVDGSATGN